MPISSNLTDEVFNIVTANGSREMEELRFHQAVENIMIRIANSKLYTITAHKGPHTYVVGVYDSEHYEQAAQDEWKYRAGGYKIRVWKSGLNDSHESDIEHVLTIPARKI